MKKKPSPAQRVLLEFMARHGTIWQDSLNGRTVECLFQNGWASQVFNYRARITDEGRAAIGLPPVDPTERGTLKV